MKYRLKFIRNQLVIILLVIAFFFVFTHGNKSGTVKTLSIDSVRSVQAVNLKMRYNPVVIETMRVSTIAEVAKYASTNPVIFEGTMTAYGPDCIGCSGYVACPPNPSVKNTDVYNDREYGKIRVVAADRAIPCGTIVKVTGTKEIPEFIAIVLDRGGVIKGTLMDLLYRDENSTYYFGRQNVTYEIIRWGW